MAKERRAPGRYFIWICRRCRMQTQGRSCPYCKAVDPPIPYTENCDWTEVAVVAEEPCAA
jgi:predicted RNA-binding protein with PUA domain